MRSARTSSGVSGLSGLARYASAQVRRDLFRPEPEPSTTASFSCSVRRSSASAAALTAGGVSTGALAPLGVFASGVIVVLAPCGVAAAATAAA